MAGVATQLVAVAAGGAGGAVARFLVQTVVGASGAPLAVLIVNVLGSFLAGVGLQWFNGAAIDSGWSNTLSLLFVTGFCGAFTTMSAMTVQARDLAMSDGLVTAAGYSALNVLLSIFALLLGAWTIR
ncbi:MAG: CrcB family protein [Pseudomonadota bacterium]